jgi:hypothetical protein
MAKKHSFKFWLSFWFLAVIFLAGWYLFLEYRKQNYLGLLSLVKPIVKVLPLQSVQKKELAGTLGIVDSLSRGKSTFLILFQNNNELRPGGGYIGSFGIMKIADGQIVFIDTHDTNVFDSGFSTKIKPPKPMQDMLNIKNWELRDSNWSPDFRINAQRAKHFYHLEGGQEKIDGVIAISTRLLPSFLEVVGPVQIDGYPGIYDSQNVIEQLEYQVEKGYYDQGIEKGKRKYIMKKMAKAIIKKAQGLDWSQRKILINKVEQHLNQKDVMLYFEDKDLQKTVERLGWSGAIREKDSEDYLMIVDANLGSRKSDAVVDRSFNYTVDFRRKKPVAKLEINYLHKGRVRDLLTDDYRTYLRVLIPEQSWLYDTEGLEGLEFIDFDKILDKKSFGVLHKVNLGKSKKVIFNYYLPESITADDYQLFVQKQPGIDRLKGKIKIINKMGDVKNYTIDADRDVKIIYQPTKKENKTPKVQQTFLKIALADEEK